MSTKELQEALTNKHLYITRITDNIAEAEMWFNDRCEVVLISKGQIWMRKNVENALLCWKIANDRTLEKTWRMSLVIAQRTFIRDKCHNAQNYKPLSGSPLWFVVQILPSESAISNFSLIVNVI